MKTVSILLLVLCPFALSLSPAAFGRGAIGEEAPQAKPAPSPVPLGDANKTPWGKPVIHFYSARECLRVDVTVTFKEGAPVVWWPCCDQPIDDGTGRLKTVFRSLVWSGWLGKSIPLDVRGGGDRPIPGESGWRETAEFELPDTCWVKPARLKGAADFTVTGTTVGRGAPWSSQQQETERFIYYDGLVPAPAGLHCTAVDEKSVTLKNAAVFPVEHLFVVDRRRAADAKGVRFAQVDKLEPGASSRVEFSDVAEGKWPEPARAAAQKALVAAGLFDTEAAAVLDIWKKGFFENAGVAGFYLLPRSEYDRMIALEISPKPGELVRVGVAFHPHLEFEPEATAKCLQLIKQLDAREWRDREDATKALAEMGPPAIGPIREALKAGAASAEVKRRCTEILDQVDAASYLPKREPAGK